MINLKTLEEIAKIGESHELANLLEGIFAFERHYTKFGGNFFKAVSPDAMHLYDYMKSKGNGYTFEIAIRIVFSRLLFGQDRINKILPSSSEDRSYRAKMDALEYVKVFLADTKPMVVLPYIDALINLDHCRRQINDQKKWVHVLDLLVDYQELIPLDERKGINFWLGEAKYDRYENLRIYLNGIFQKDGAEAAFNAIPDLIKHRKDKTAIRGLNGFLFYYTYQVKERFGYSRDKINKELHDRLSPLTDHLPVNVRRGVDDFLAVIQTDYTPIWTKPKK